MPLEKIIKNKNFLNLTLSAIQKKFAIAISGGSDSLALFYVMKDFLWKNNIYNKPILIMINHNFRQESQLECDFVMQIAEFHLFECICLNLEKNIEISGNKQDYARKMRYKLIIDFCKKNNIEVVMTAHHLDDQRETIMMRLNRGAGCDGLSGINSTHAMNDIQIIRPFLEIPKSWISHYMSKNNYLWLEDRTNNSDEYERSKTRKQLSQNHCNIDNKGLILLTKKMKNTTGALNFYRDIEYKKIVAINKNNEIYIERNSLFALPIEIILRILKKIFTHHGEKKTNRVLYEDLVDLYQRIKILENNGSLQFGNFLILSCDNCFLFKKLN